MAATCKSFTWYLSARRQVAILSYAVAGCLPFGTVVELVPTRAGLKLSRKAPLQP